MRYREQIIWNTPETTDAGKSIGISRNLCMTYASFACHTGTSL